MTSSGKGVGFQKMSYVKTYADWLVWCGMVWYGMVWYGVVWLVWPNKDGKMYWCGMV